MVSAALCLTAFVGCLTVNAETLASSAVYKVNDANVTLGKTSTEVTADCTSLAEVCAHKVVFTFPAGFTVDTVYATIVEDPEVEATEQTLNAYVENSSENWHYVKNVDAEGKTTIAIAEIANFTSDTETIATASISFRFALTIGESVTATTYTVGIDCDAADYDENWLTATKIPGTITVADAHTHDYTILQNDETNHWYECKCGDATEPEAHKYGEGVVTKPANETEDGVMTYTCTVCGYEKTETISYTETLVEMEPKHVLDLQSSIMIGFTLPKTTFDGCTDIYAMCSKESYASGSLTVTEPVRVEAEEYSKDDSKYIFFYKDVHAKEMGNNTFTTFYGVKADGTVIYSNEHVYSIKQYATDGLALYSKYTAYDKLCTVLVDMVNYGAAAQIQFNYNTADLVNADFEQYQEKYATTTMPTLTNKDATTPNEGQIVEIGRTLSLESAITIDATFAYSGDVSNFRMKFIYKDLANVEHELYVASEDFVYNSKTGKYSASLKALKVPQMNDVVTFELYDGETLISNTREYSIGSYAYAAQNLSDSYQTLKDVTIAMMRFGDSATAYFGRS